MLEIVQKVMRIFIYSQCNQSDDVLSTFAGSGFEPDAAADGGVAQDFWDS